MRPFFAFLLACAAGCGIAHERGGGGGGGDGGGLVPDAGPRPDASVPPRDAWSPPFAIAPHGPLPVIPDQGGARMAHPQLVLVFYPDDPNRATLEDDARNVVASRWLDTVGAEYGVGSGSILGVVTRTTPAPSTVTGSELDAFLTNGIAAGTLPTGPGGSTDSVLYVHYFPGWTTIDDGVLGQSCVTHGGYHYETTGAHPVSYAVIPACASFNTMLTDIESQELAFSHELIEAATDPFPLTGEGWGFGLMDFSPSPWLVAGFEVADLCEYRSGTVSYAREGSFAYCRVWSNAAARLGDRDPCAPSNTAAPWGTVTSVPDEIQFVMPGGSFTFDLTAWSNAPMAPMQVVAFAGGGGDGFFTPDVFLDRTAMTNGDHASLTLTAPFGTPAQTYGLAYLQVTLPNGDTDLLPFSIVVP